MFLKLVTPAQVRKDDPFVAATLTYLADLVKDGKPAPQPIRGYLAGGLGVRCYSPVRTTSDIDMFFEGGRVMIPPNTTILAKANNATFALTFDHQYTPNFGLMNEDFTQRSVELAKFPAAGLDIHVLHPVDLVISKIARFEDHDRRDIAALARTMTFDAQAMHNLAESPLQLVIGNSNFVRANLHDAMDIVQAAQTELRRERGPSGAEL